MLFGLFILHIQSLLQLCRISVAWNNSKLYIYMYALTTVQKFKVSDIFSKEISYAHHGCIYLIKNVEKL